MNDEDGATNQFIELTLFNQIAFDTNDTPSDGLRIDFSPSANSNVDDLTQ